MFPLKGKVLNVREASHKQASETFQNLSFFFSFSFFLPQIVSQVDVATSIITLAHHGIRKFDRKLQKKCENKLLHLRCRITTSWSVIQLNANGGYSWQRSKFEKVEVI